MGDSLETTMLGTSSGARGELSVVWIVALSEVDAFRSSTTPSVRATT